MADSWVTQQPTGLPQLSLFDSHAAEGDSWADPAVSRCLPQETVATFTAPPSLGPAELLPHTPSKPAAGLSPLKRLVSGPVAASPTLPMKPLARATSASVPAPASAPAVPLLGPWAHSATTPLALRKAVPLPLTSGHVFGHPASIMSCAQQCLKDAGVTVTAQPQQWQLSCFHFDGHDAAEFQVRLHGYDTAAGHHILELRRTPGSTAAGAGGLLLGRLFHNIATALRTAGIAVQSSTTSNVSSLLTTPAPGTGKGGDSRDDGVDVLGSLSQPGVTLAMLNAMAPKTRGLPRWHSGSALLGGRKGSFSEKQADAAAASGEEEEGEGGDPTPPSRGLMFNTLASMRSARHLPTAPAVSEEEEGGEEDGPPMLVGAGASIAEHTPASAASAAGLDPEALHSAQAGTLTPAQSTHLWAPLTAMLLHGGAGQREEAVKALASLSRNVANHDSLAKARLPALLGNMLGLTPVGGGESPPSPTLTPHGNPLTRVARALAVAVMGNLVASPVGTRALEAAGILPALQAMLGAAGDTASDAEVGESEGEEEGVTLPPTSAPPAGPATPDSLLAAQDAPAVGLPQGPASTVSSLLAGAAQGVASLRARIAPRRAVFKAFVMGKVADMVAGAKAVAARASGNPGLAHVPGAAERAAAQPTVRWGFAPPPLPAGQPAATITVPVPAARGVPVDVAAQLAALPPAPTDTDARAMAAQVTPSSSNTPSPAASRPVLA